MSADSGVACRGQYSDAVLNELESQNDAQVEGIMGKVRLLKDVCGSPTPDPRPPAPDPVFAPPRRTPGTDAGCGMCR